VLINYQVIPEVKMFKKSLITPVVLLLIPAFACANENSNEDKHDHDHQEKPTHHEHKEEKIERIQVSASRLGRIVTESATRIK